MENFFLDVIFVVADPDPATALEYSGKGLIKAGKQMPSMSESYLKVTINNFQCPIILL